MQNPFQIMMMIVAFNFLSAIAFGQNQWTRQSPLPAARNLTGAAWATVTHGFASGERETLIETFDGGATWRNVNLSFSPSEPFYNVSCRDAGNCFVIGNSSTNGPDHWRTTDGGATWQRITNFPLGGSWRQIDFVSASVGFMGSNGAVVRTIDGGVTWALMSGYPDCPVIYGMDFRDAQVGLAGGDRVSATDGGPGIFKTTDAGATWVRKFPQPASDVVWLNGTTAVATVLGPIYRSTDAGETWSEISSQISTGGFSKMTLLPNGTIVGVSGKGDAWRSADGGFNWTQTLVGLGALPASWSVSFLDNQVGAIVGQSGFIFKTTDGGLTWTMLNNGIGGVEFRDLEMFDDSAGLAVGDNGYFLRTANGGSRWETGRLQVTGVVAGRNENLQAVSVVDANFAVAAGFEGVVYKTFDRGVTWQSIGYPNLPGDYFISDVKFINRNVGYVTGNRPGGAQGLFRTTDGGATWTPVFPNGGYSLDFIDANRGWVINLNGLGYRTTDGGATWQQMILPNQGFAPSISKIDFINQNAGWAVGRNGYAAHTTDGGATWQLQNIAPSADVILGLHALSEMEVFAVGASSVGNGTFYHTNNAGATWNTSPLPSQYSLSSIFAMPSRKVWTSGFDGTVLHNPNSTAATSVVSRKTHGTAGAFDIDLPLTGNPGIECRSGGGSGAHTLIATFSNLLTAGNATVSSGAGTVSSASVIGNTIAINLTAVADRQAITVTLSNVTDSFGQTLPPIDIRMSLLLGDTAGNGLVNSSDVGQVKANTGAVLSQANFRADVTANGMINSSDIALVKAASGGTSRARQ